MGRPRRHALRRGARHPGAGATFEELPDLLIARFGPLGQGIIVSPPAGGRRRGFGEVIAASWLLRLGWSNPSGAWGRSVRRRHGIDPRRASAAPIGAALSAEPSTRGNSPMSPGVQKRRPPAWKGEANTPVDVRCVAGRLVPRGGPALPGLGISPGGAGPPTAALPRPRWPSPRCRDPRTR